MEYVILIEYACAQSQYGPFIQPQSTCSSLQRSRSASGGFEVFSAWSESQAHFEIEMGRCGVLVMCFRSSPETARELTQLFRKNCPDGRLIFIVKDVEPPFYADALILERDEGTALVNALKPAKAA